MPARIRVHALFGELRAGSETFTLVTLHVTCGKSVVEHAPELRGVERWMRKSGPVTNAARRSRIRSLGAAIDSSASPEAIMFGNEQTVITSTPTKTESH